MDKKSFFDLKIFQKLKNIKHIELFIAIILGAVVILIYLSSMGSSTKSKSQQSSTASITSISEYSNFLENKLENVLAKIEGAGNVAAMITFESGTEFVYAQNEESKTNSNTNAGVTTAVTTTSISPYTKNAEGLIVKEILPKVSGVIVVASGAKDTRVKLEIVKAIQAILEVPLANIEVLVGK